MALTTRQTIIDAIYALLIANQGAGTVYAMTGGRIYDTLAADDPTLPFVVFTVVDDQLQQYFSVDSIQMDFQVDVYGPRDTSIGGPKACRVIGDAAMALLHRSAITISGANGCSILCQSGTQGLDMDYVAGGSTQLDAYRDTRVYRLFGTGT